MSVGDLGTILGLPRGIWGAIWCRFGSILAPKGFLFEAWGEKGVTLGTLGATLGTQGVTLLENAVPVHKIKGLGGALGGPGAIESLARLCAHGAPSPPDPLSQRGIGPSYTPESRSRSAFRHPPHVVCNKLRRLNGRV